MKGVSYLLAGLELTNSRVAFATEKGLKTSSCELTCASTEILESYWRIGTLKCDVSDRLSDRLSDRPP